MQIREVAEWNRQQIETILSSTTDLQNEAWIASIETATSALERGWRATLFPRNAARLVLGRAVQFRQAETAPAGRWHLACLVESLATLRLLSLTHGNLVPVAEYFSARAFIFEHFRKPREAQRRRHFMRRLSD